MPSVICFIVHILASTVQSLLGQFSKHNCTSLNHHDIALDDIFSPKVKTKEHKTKHLSIFARRIIERYRVTPDMYST